MLNTITQWSGERFGTTFEFNGRNMIAHLKDDKVAMRRKLKRKAEALGINAEAWIKDSRVEVGQWNVAQWLEMEKFIDKTAKRYWVDDRTGKKTKEEIAQIEKDGKYTPPERKYVEGTNIPEEVEKSLQGQNISSLNSGEGSVSTECNYPMSYYQLRLESMRRYPECFSKKPKVRHFLPKVRQKTLTRID